jgi:hypothetical protein
VDVGALADRRQEGGADAFVQSRNEPMARIAAKCDELADALTAL